jgi:hypothetical protein
MRDRGQRWRRVSGCPVRGRARDLPDSRGGTRDRVLPGPRELATRRAGCFKRRGCLRRRAERGSQRKQGRHAAPMLGVRSARTQQADMRSAVQADVSAETASGGGLALSHARLRRLWWGPAACGRSTECAAACGGASSGAGRPRSTGETRAASGEQRGASGRASLARRGRGGSCPIYGRGGRALGARGPGRARGVEPEL